MALGQNYLDLILKKATEDAGQLPGFKAWLQTVELWASCFTGSL